MKETDAGKHPEEQTGIVIRGVGGLYGVRPFPLLPDGETILCRARGVFRHENISPLPGDRVVILPADASVKKRSDSDADHVIDRILPRRNTLIRPPLANLTHLFLVIPCAEPEPDLLVADELICIAEADDIEPVILVTKRDLAPGQAEEICEIYRHAGFTALTLSANEPESAEALRALLLKLAAYGDTVAAFAGASGAGKSTLMGRLFPSLSFTTGELSRKIRRGRQTTRTAELFPFAEGENILFIADTPGFSMLDFTEYNYFDPAILPETFREFVPYLGKCRYTKCTHTKEEGCAILEAMHAGVIDRGRCEHYAEIFTALKKKPDWKRRQEERKGK